MLPSGGFGSSSSNVTRSGWGRPPRRVAAENSKEGPGDGGAGDRGAAGPDHEDDNSSSSSSSDNAVVRAVNAQLAKSFGGCVWFSVLAVSLGIVGVGYAYLLYNYADVPILRGPQGHL